MSAQSEGNYEGAWKHIKNLEWKLKRDVAPILSAIISLANISGWHQIYDGLPLAF